MRVLVCSCLGSWLLVAALATWPLEPTLPETQQEPGPTGIQRTPVMGDPIRTTGCSKHVGTILVCWSLYLKTSLFTLL